MSVQSNSRISKRNYFTFDLCVCCLRRDVALISMIKCKHSALFSKLFHYKTAVPLKWICWQCHALLMKTVAFKKQVENSIVLLNKMLNYRKVNQILPVEPVFSLKCTAVKTTSIYENQSNHHSKDKLTNHNTEIWLEESSTNETEQNWPDKHQLADWIERPAKEEVEPTHEEEEFPVTVKVEKEDSDMEENVPLSQINVTADLLVPMTKTSRTSKHNTDDKYDGKVRVVSLSKEEYLVEKERERSKEAYLKLPFRCDDCVMGFDYDVTLQEHMEKRHGKVANQPGPSGLKTDIVTLKQSLLESLHIDLNIKSEPNTDDEDIELNTKSEPNTDDEDVELNTKSEPDTDDEDVELNTKSEPDTDDEDVELNTKSEPDTDDEDVELNTKSEPDTDDEDVELNTNSESNIDDDDDEESVDESDVKLEPIDFVASNSKSFDDELEPATKKACQHEPADKWALYKTFNARSQAEKFIKAVTYWRLQAKLCSETVKYYRCKAPGRKCGAFAKIEISKSGSAEMYYSENKHSCNMNNKTIPNQTKPKQNQTKYRISSLVKNEISKLQDMKMKPLQIMKHLQEKYEVAPTKSQLYACLLALKKKKFKKPALGGIISLSFTELKSCIQQNTDVPIDMDTGFVLDSAIDTEKRSLRFVISTKRLMKNALECQDLSLHTNSTHQLHWYGYPVILIGMTDRNERFHLLAIAVCSEVKAEDYAFIFNSLKRNFSEILHTELTPKVLVADSAAAIQEGFRKVFPSTPVRICWNHMRATVNEDKNHLPYVDDMLDDLDFVQTTASQAEFSKCLKLFLNKWAKTDKEIFIYFTLKWMAANQGWYESFCPGTFSTNASLEWASHDLKIEHNIPEKLQPKRFCSLIKAIAESSSSKYKNGRLKIANVVSITPKMMMDGYVWSLMKKNLHRCDTGSFTEYIIPRGDNLSVDTRLLGVSATTFDKFVETRSSCHKLYMPKGSQNWLKGRCTCVVFLKTFMCKHLLGLAMELEYVVPSRDIVQKHRYSLQQQMIKKNKQASTTNQTPVINLN